LPSLLDPIAVTIIPIVVLESPVSYLHALAAFAATAAGCGRLFFILYSLYQAVASLEKALLVPAYTRADLSWDLVGDIFEYMIGAGAAWLLGLAADEPRSDKIAKICSPWLLAALLAASALFWAAAYASGWVPPPLRGS